VLGGLTKHILNNDMNVRLSVVEVCKIDKTDFDYAQSDIPNKLFYTKMPQNILICLGAIFLIKYY
jgi:hypothetical protein